MAGMRGSLVGGRYRLDQEIGEGGTGRVWRGLDQLLDRVVAVKEIRVPPGLSGPERDVLARRTLQEARSAARLSHAGVIAIYDVVEEDGVPWIVMEHVAGRSLKEEIDASGRLSWQDAARIGGQVADALAAAHAAGIVHRDLKPDNVMLCEDRAVVTDFGIARVVDSATTLTPDGTVLGTPRYMAPEQLDGKRAGPPADLWSLGATLYAAVEGRPPFFETTQPALYTAVLTKAPPLPSFAGPLTGHIRDLLSKKPEDRPDARTMAQDLLSLASDGDHRQGDGSRTLEITGVTQAGTPQSSPGYTGPARPGPADGAPGRRRRRLTFLGGGAAVLVLAMVGGEGAYLVRSGAGVRVGLTTVATPADRPTATAVAAGPRATAAATTAGPRAAERPQAPSPSASPVPAGLACLAGTWRFTWVEIPYGNAQLSGRTDARLSISRQGAYNVDWNGSTPMTGIARGSRAERTIQGTDHEQIVVTAPSSAASGTLAATGISWSFGSMITVTYQGTAQYTAPGPIDSYTAEYQCTRSRLTMSDSDGVQATAVRLGTAS